MTDKIKQTLSPAEIMQVSPIIPVIALEDAKQALPLAESLIAGGIRILEITLRTDAALDSIKSICQHYPEAVVGAGTVINSDNLKRVQDIGAQFAISPGSTVDLLTAAKKDNFPLLPGVATASEVMQGLALGYTHFKLFPAINVGGIGLLKALSGPFPQLMFCPTGGITVDNAKDFLALNNVLCVGGSWLAPKQLLKTQQFTEIRKLAENAITKTMK